MHYLMFMERMLRQSYIEEPVRFLFSGTDRIVRRAVLQDIVKRCREKGEPLYIVDDTDSPSRDDYSVLESMGYRIKNGLSGKYCLFDPFRINSMTGTRRLRQLLEVFGYDEMRKAKLLAYFRFLQYLETLGGNTGSEVLSAEMLSEYGTYMAVEEKIQGLLDAGVINARQQISLISKYSEYSAAAADFEDILLLLLPFIRGEDIYASAAPDSAFLIPLGKLGRDEAVRKAVLELLQAGMEERGSEEAAVLVFDRGYGNRKSVSDFLESLPENMDVHVLSEDIFTLCNDSGRAGVLNRFTARVYSRHVDMDSCGKVEKEFGVIDVVHKTYTESYDRRLRANSPFDILFGKNKTDIYGYAAPREEPRYRKEMIARLEPGSGIISFMGQSSSFNV
ncbi:MAG: hypothetical protein Q4D81_09970 [Eubacteriales bacterium]|nr:hypothetical protein [Eubacteriales bacterium]